MSKSELIQMITMKQSELKKSKRKLSMYKFRSNFYLFLGLLFISTGIIGITSSLIVIYYVDINLNERTSHMFMTLPSIISLAIGIIITFILRSNTEFTIKRLYKYTIQVIERDLDKLQQNYNILVLGVWLCY